MQLIGGVWRGGGRRKEEGRRRRRREEEEGEGRKRITSDNDELFKVCYYVFLILNYSIV